MEASTFYLPCINLTNTSKPFSNILLSDKWPQLQSNLFTKKKHGFMVALGNYICNLLFIDWLIDPYSLFLIWKIFLYSNLQQGYDQKNIRRRVYDALNVLMAMNIISKEKKEIKWIGLPTNSAQECQNLEVGIVCMETLKTNYTSTVFIKYFNAF